MRVLVLTPYPYGTVAGSNQRVCASAELSGASDFD